MKREKRRIIINKQLEGDKNTPGLNMWCGICLGCLDQWQYWYFGAALGHGLEHLRRCGREVQ